MRINLATPLVESLREDSQAKHGHTDLNLHIAYLRGIEAAVNSLPGGQGPPNTTPNFTAPPDTGAAEDLLNLMD
jgi:hypothetical protein